MRHPFEKLGVLLGLLLTITWPMLLGGLLAGREGIVFGALVYAAFGVVFLLLVLFSGIRGIFSC